MDDLPTIEQRRAQHRAWIASFGFSPRDWRRIEQLVDEVTPGYSPAALDDLDVAVRVGVCQEAAVGRLNGNLMGVAVRKRDGARIAVLYWTMSGSALERWQARR